MDFSVSITVIEHTNELAKDTTTANSCNIASPQPRTCSSGAG